MKNRTKRLIGLLLVLSMLLSLVSGCTSGSTDEKKTVGRETYDSATSFTIDYTGPTEPTIPQEEEQEGIFQSVLDEDTTFDESQPTFEPLSEEELSQIADEVREEIEESYTQPEEVKEENAGAISEAAGTAGNNAATNEAATNDLAPEGIGAANNEPKQLTIEDIQAMNPNSLVIDCYTNDGYLSTLVGKFYDKKVTNYEEGVQSIQGLASLLGLSKGCDFFIVYSETNNTGYTFYTYQQRYGGNTLQFATLRIIVDPQGYTAGLSCSFVPNVGTATITPKISKEQAENLVQTRFAKYNLTFYSEQTVQLAVPFAANVYNCWVIYTNNPDSDDSFDMPYLEHYVSTDGYYITQIPANTFAKKNEEVMDNTGYFKNMKVETYSTTFKLEDGSFRDISVPISYNSRDKKYYLMDPSRLIAVAQFYDFNYRDSVNFVTSDTIDGFSQNNLLAYANYIIMYDFYADHGIKSVDAFGTPILVTVGWCDANHNPVNNACFYGVNNGWACFGVSDVNHSSDCVDVVGHEYTHGVTRQSMQGTLYQNETGAINEAYSDIMGNLAEMSMNYTADRTWKCGERSGKISRDMGRPNDYKQPVFIGDEYYMSPVPVPDSPVNDYGAVHINNSLIGHIAYLMDQAGMSYEEQISMWLTSIELITPRSDYEDLHAALLFSLKINGMLGTYGAALNQAFKDGGMNENWSKSYLTVFKEGYGRLQFQVDKRFMEYPSMLWIATTDGKIISHRGYPDMNGTVSVLLPEGTYICQMMAVDNEKNTETYYNYGGNSWAEGGQFMTFDIVNGQITEITSTDGKKPSSQTSPTPQSSGKLKLVTFDAGYFNMLMPEGWNIEVNGQYAGIGIKLTDPNDPSTQFFFYGGLSPYHKSEQTKRFWAMYDKTGVIANGPVLTQHDIIGILDCWNYCADYQMYYENRSYFTKMYDMVLRGGGYYNGPYAAVGGIESGCMIDCTTAYGDKCYLTICGALVDEDYLGVYGGNWFYSGRGIVGIMAPTDRYAAVFDDLITCFKSLTFSTGYILESQYTDPMADMPTIRNNLDFMGNIMTEIYVTFK
ncbi:MAG: M4 family metallopeptidase [Firmicutes bacterium]|nr:M4 family metallopeptidase [Bacillota bacterium]